MKTPAPADLQRWSEEVANDPSSLAFLPLARAYRRMGQSEAALQLCLRGLEHYPGHVEGHSLLALLYLESGKRDRAADEWSMVLRLEPNHFDALRGIGFCYLEQDQLSRARQTLERAALLRPNDPAVQEALRLLGTRQELQSAAGTSAALDEPWADDAPAGTVDAMAEPWAEPWAEAPAGEPAGATSPAPEAPAMAAPISAPISAPVNPAPVSAPPVSSDPTQLFAAVLAAGPALGALLLDGRGLVLAGSLESGSGADAEAMGAILGSAIEEARRTVSHLSMGRWQGMLLDTDNALLFLAPAAGDGILLFAAKRNAPTGWVLRSAAQAGELAAKYLESYA